MLCTAASLIKQEEGSKVFFSADVKGVTGMESMKKQYNNLEYLRRKGGVCVCVHALVWCYFFSPFFFFFPPPPLSLSLLQASIWLPSEL